MPNNPWKPEEVDALRAGVEEHGTGNWQYIKEQAKGALASRSGVDLKDKWRNLEKAQKREAGGGGERRETRSGGGKDEAPKSAPKPAPKPAAEPPEPKTRAGKAGAPQRTVLQQAGDEEAAERAGKASPDWREAGKKAAPRRTDDEDDDDLAARVPDAQDDAVAPPPKLPEPPAKAKAVPKAAEQAEKDVKLWDSMLKEMAPKTEPEKTQAAKAAPERPPERQAEPPAKKQGAKKAASQPVADADETAAARAGEPERRALDAELAAAREQALAAAAKLEAVMRDASKRCGLAEDQKSMAVFDTVLKGKEKKAKAALERQPEPPEKEAAVPEKARGKKAPALKSAATQTPPEKAHAATSPPRLSQLEDVAPKAGAARKTAAAPKAAAPPLREISPQQQPAARPPAQRPDAPKRVAFADQAPPRGKPARRDEDDAAFDSDDDAAAAAGPRPRATPHPARADARDVRGAAAPAAALDVGEQLSLLRRGFVESVQAYEGPVSVVVRDLQREMRELSRSLAAGGVGGARAARSPSPAPLPRGGGILTTMSVEQQMQTLLLADQIREAYRKRDRGDGAAPGDENDEEDEQRPRRARRTSA